MKTINKIFGIGLIALIAMVGIGAVSAEPVGNEIIKPYDPSLWANGAVGYSDNGVEYNDTITESRGGITVDDWNVNLKSWNYTPCPEPTIECDGVPNECPAPCDVTGGLTKSFNIDDWNGYTAGELPDSSLNPPRPDINIPYYPTEQTDIVLP